MSMLKLYFSKYREIYTRRACLIHLGARSIRGEGENRPLAWRVFPRREKFTRDVKQTRTTLDCKYYKGMIINYAGL